MDIMIDLETLGTDKCSSVIMSVGVASFHRAGNSFFNKETFYLDLNSQLKEGMTVEGPTIQWWLRQSEDARKDVANSHNSLNIHQLPSILSIYFENNNFVSGRDKVWAYAADFDLAILRHHFGMIGKQTIWSYRDTACARTIVWASGINRDSVDKDIQDRGIDLCSHVAGDDAARQVFYVQAAMRKLGI